jgi:superfamily II DNA or RNA helicase
MSAIVTLRPDQNQVKGGITVKWLGGLSFILAVAATGWGKTVLFSKIIAEEPGASVVIAHRHELVGQISMALARNGVRHRVVGSSELAKDCTAAHIDELGVNYVDPNSRVGVASVDTLILKDGNDWQAWFDSIKLWVMDEAHHLLRHNKWGKAVALFRNARGLGVTAETERADGYGLGEMNDGIFQDIVLAPTMRDVINMGNLTDYKVYVPPSDLDLSTVDVSPGGDFSPKKLAKATKNSHITGDVVKHYLKLAPGKLGITFAVDIEAATEIAKSFREAGVPAEVVTSKTKSTVRRKILKDFRNRKILQLVNVDLFGEGFDLPAIEVVSMARATQSFNLYKQQFGRALRLMAGKLWAIIIDHVGNVIRHGLPDQKRDFTLGRPVPRAQRDGDEDVIPMTVCTECSHPYERIHAACPACKYKREPAARTAPAYVDGDLFELSQETMARMRGEADAVISTSSIPMPQGLPAYAERAIEARHIERASSQARLRDTLALWAGWQRDHKGYTDSEIYRLHYITYGMDMLSAQVLNAVDADALRMKLQKQLDSHGVVALA